MRSKCKNQNKKVKDNMCVSLFEKKYIPRQLILILTCHHITINNIKRPIIEQFLSFSYD